MSERFVPRKKDPYGSDPRFVRKSIVELRSVYSGMTEDQYAKFYEDRYGVRAKVVKDILRGAEDGL